MPTWIEIRCEDRSEGTHNNRCWSDDNAGPMGWAGDDDKSITKAMVGLRKEAAKAKWEFTKDCWICPFCAAVRKEKIKLSLVKK